MRCNPAREALPLIGPALGNGKNREPRAGFLCPAPARIPRARTLRAVDTRDGLECVRPLEVAFRPAGVDSTPRQLGPTIRRRRGRRFEHRQLERMSGFVAQLL
jgi:hypothetical protein